MRPCYLHLLIIQNILLRDQLPYCQQQQRKLRRYIIQQICKIKKARKMKQNENMFSCGRGIKVSKLQWELDMKQITFSSSKNSFQCLQSHYTNLSIFKPIEKAGTNTLQYLDRKLRKYIDKFSINKHVLKLTLEEVFVDGDSVCFWHQHLG